MPRYGVLGGTFDPIHLAHLILAESAREAGGLEKVIFIPAHNPPHKPGLVAAPAADRLRMVETAISDNPWFDLSRVEMDRPGPSYTIDTVRQLSASVPEGEWSLILGSDTLAEIHTWRDFRSLLPMVRILAAVRPGFPASVPENLAPWADRISFFSIPELGISSTLIRERISCGSSVRYLLPDKVAEYIEEHNLYRSQDPGRVFLVPPGPGRV